MTTPAPGRTHAVRYLNVAASIADEDTAGLLRARIEEFARDRAPAQLARLFDELAPLDRHVRLDRLELDLGTLPADGFEEAAAQALEHAIKTALPGKIAAAAGDPGGEDRSLDEHQARLELLEHYLARGTVPFWARARPFVLPILLREIQSAQRGELSQALRRVGRDRVALERLVLQTRDHERRSLLELLAPGHATLIEEFHANIAAIQRERPLVPLQASDLERVLWLATFEYLLREPQAPFDRGRFLARLSWAMAERAGIADADVLAWLRDAPRARRWRWPSRAALAATLKDMPAGEPLREQTLGNRNAAPPAGEPLYVSNAGLVLFNPFLPRFFEQLSVLKERPNGNPCIAGVEAASRAVHLLQYLVDERCDRPEPELVLNKLLCGLDPSVPIAPAIEPSETDRDLCGQLINAVIANWTAIKNTSPAGLRQTFLQREGRLTRGADGPGLRVQRKTVDMLVDQLPWSFGVIFQRWMEKALRVTW